MDWSLPAGLADYNWYFSAGCDSPDRHRTESKQLKDRTQQPLSYSTIGDLTKVAHGWIESLFIGL
jgi:hypothetical protein